MITLDSTVRTVRAMLAFESRCGGATCPACDQTVRVYRRKLNAAMARGLLTMHRVHGTDWGHAPSTEDLAQLGGELARLRMWGLVEEAAEPRPDGGRAGWWRVTSLGVRFARGEVSMPSHAEIYNGKLLKLDDSEMISISGALGEKFSLTELLAA